MKMTPFKNQYSTVSSHNSLNSPIQQRHKPHNPHEMRMRRSQRTTWRIWPSVWVTSCSTRRYWWCWARRWRWLGAVWSRSAWWGCPRTTGSNWIVTTRRSATRRRRWSSSTSTSRRKRENNNNEGRVGEAKINVMMTSGHQIARLQRVTVPRGSIIKEVAAIVRGGTESGGKKG